MPPVRHRLCRGTVALLLAIAAGVCPWRESRAATIEYDIQPRVLQLGESATCRITIRGAAGAPAPSLPPIPGFDISSTGTEQSYSMSPNGQESSVAYVYRLTPRELGTFTIGPFSYAIRDDQVTLPAVEIKVVAPGTGSSASPTQRLSDLLFAALTTDRPRVYVQQSFTMKLSIYSQGLNLDRDVRLVDFDTSGLKIEGYDEMAGTREVVNNQVYDVRHFRVRATALTAGTFTLAPRLRLNIVVPNQRRDPFSSFFGDAFFSRPETRPVDVAAQPLDLVVRELPEEGRPASFSGAVGKYSFEVTARPLQLNVGDPVTLNLTIRGQGNLAHVTPPALDLGDAFKVYEPKLVSDANDGSQRSFEQVIIPRTSQATELPAVSFSFFDPEAESYQTVTHGPFPLLLKSSGETSPLVLQGPGRSATSKPAELGSDIAYLKQAPRRWVRLQHTPWYDAPAMRALQVVPPLALAILFLAMRRRDRLATDTAQARRLQAPRSARAAMAVAERLLAQGPRSEFLESLWRVLTTYFGHRFNLAPGEVSRDEVARRLQRADLPAPEVLEIGQFFTDCESLRFGGGRSDAPVLSAEEQQIWRQRLQRLSKLLRDCERLRL